MGSRVLECETEVSENVEEVIEEQNEQNLPNSDNTEEQQNTESEITTSETIEKNNKSLKQIVMEVYNDIPKTKRLNFIATNTYNIELNDFTPIYPPLISTGLSNIYNIDPVAVTNDELKTEIIENKQHIFVSRHNMDVYKSYIHCSLVATNEEILVCWVTIYGEIYLNFKSLDIINKIYNNENALKNLISKCFEIMYNIKCKYIKHKYNEYDKDNLATILYKILVKNNIKKSSVSEVITSLKQHISMELSNLFNFETSADFNLNSMTPMLLGNNIYKRSLIISNNKMNRIKDNAYREGLTTGMKYFTGLQIAGYIKDPNNSDVWFKSVDIVPEMCVMNGYYWEIPKKHRSYHVSKLFVKLSHMSGLNEFVMYSDQTHPNIASGGRLCLGDDLRKEWNQILDNKFSDMNRYVNFIKDIEKSLAVPNFDSSYFQHPYNKEFIKIDENNKTETNNKKSCRRVLE